MQHLKDCAYCFFSNRCNYERDTGLTLWLLYLDLCSCGHTLLGGLYSVAYTDIIQLSVAFLSLVSCSATKDVLYLL